MENNSESYIVVKEFIDKGKTTREVLQEQFEMDTDMGGDIDGTMRTSRSNLKILLEGAKNGKLYATGGKIKGRMQIELAACTNPDDNQRRHSRRAIPAYKVPVSSYEEASRLVQEFIEDNDLGGGNWSGGAVYKNGKQVAYVSYNGRVWEGKSPEKGKEINIRPS